MAPKLQLLFTKIIKLLWLEIIHLHQLLVLLVSRAYSFSEVLILALINPKYDTSMYKTIATNVWFMSFGKSVE